MIEHRRVRLIFPLLLTSAAAMSGACGGDRECNQSACGSMYICDSAVDITATVPPIQQQTWTVKGCLDTQCDSVELDAATASSGYGVLMAELQSEGGMWKLVGKLDNGAPIDGAPWSLAVTDTQGKVIARGSGTVHTAPGTGGCQHVAVTLP